MKIKLSFWLKGSAPRKLHTREALREFLKKDKLPEIMSYAKNL